MPNKCLGGISPDSAIEKDRFEDVLKLVILVEEEIPT